MRFAKLSILLLLFGVGGSVSAETVYDNFEFLVPPYFKGAWTNEEPETRAAQPFLLGDNDTVTSVTLAMWRNKEANGTVYIDIFDDSGSGTPGVSVGRLGSIDAMSIDFCYFLGP